MDKITFEVSGFTELYKKFNKLEDNAKQEVKNEFGASALKIQSDAKRLAPVNYGTLRNSIALTSQGDYSKFFYKVYTNLKYAPYVEFGTGGLVSVPQGYEELAIRYKGKGIRKINLRARPFLIPSFEQEKPKLLQRLKNILNAKS